MLGSIGLLSVAAPGHMTDWCHDNGTSTYIIINGYKYWSMDGDDGDTVSAHRLT